VLDKRQLSIKITANSIYGQTGAKTSPFYAMDVAASTTATGRSLLLFAKSEIERNFGRGSVHETSVGAVAVDADCVYGDTDSVFVAFKPSLAGVALEGKAALKASIELGQQAGACVTKQLKQPHDLEYEKTFYPLCLLSKKRYVGLMYETDVEKCQRKSMGIVLKRRDNAAVVKDIYGGVIDIIMTKQDVGQATRFLDQSLGGIAAMPIDKLVITKSLRSNYAAPERIAHKVLAERIADRDPGNAPRSGDRIAYVHIVPKGKSKGARMGDRIETVAYVQQKRLPIDYGYYVTNQIMNPIQQLFALVLEQLDGFAAVRAEYEKRLEKIYETCYDDETCARKSAELRAKITGKLLFDPTLRALTNKGNRQSELTSFFGSKP